MKKVFIYEKTRGFRPTHFRVEEITPVYVTINGNKYSRKEGKLVGRVEEIRISADGMKAIGRSFPIYH